MAENRKLGRTADQRVAMLKNMATDVIWHGQIETTESRAKEVKSIVDSLISLAIKEKDNFENVEVKVSRAKLDDKGCKITEKATSKKPAIVLAIIGIILVTCGATFQIIGNLKSNNKSNNNMLSYFVDTNNLSGK